MRVVWSSYLGDDCLRLSGWSPRALHILAAMAQHDRARRVPVYPTELVRSAVGVSNLQSVVGYYEIDGDTVCFVPGYPLLAGTSYTVLVHRSLDDATAMFELEDFEALSITRPRDESTEPRTRVVTIYPTGDELPRNQLRFYIHFSNPMSEGFVDEHVYVVDAQTREPLTGALLPMEPELWDPERMRATVLFDPARIKRGLAPHRESGYPLREGRAVEVVVDAGFRRRNRPSARERVHPALPRGGRRTTAYRASGLGAPGARGGNARSVGRSIRSAARPRAASALPHGRGRGRRSSARPDRRPCR